MMRIRDFRESDTEAIIDLYKRSVLEIAPSKYEPHAVQAWAGGEHDAVEWVQRMRNSETIVAEERETILGWIEFERSGHLAMLYCSPEAAGTGVAQQLYDTALERAKKLGISRFFADASLFSESFFLKNGWTVDERKRVTHNGADFMLARMSKSLDGS